MRFTRVVTSWQKHFDENKTKLCALSVTLSIISLFQCSRDRKFNEVLNERRDCEFCLLSFIFFAVFSDRKSMIWCESLSAMSDCRNKLYKFYCAHQSFFRINWLIFRQLWLISSICHDVWALCLRFSNAFFYFN